MRKRVTPEEKESIRKFSNKVRLRRYEMKLTQMKLSELTDSNINSIGKLERAEVDPTLSMAFRVASALQISLKELLP